MNEKEIITQIVKQLNGSKQNFLNDLQANIAGQVKARSFTDCLTLVLRDGFGNSRETIAPAASLRYARCLLAFINEKRFEGFEIDSDLTDGVVQTVVSQFEGLYDQNQEAIGSIVLVALLQDKVFRNGLTGQIMDTFSGTLPEVLKRKATSVMLTKLDSAFGHTVEHAVSKGSGVLIKQTVGAPIAHKLAFLLVKILSTNLKVIIAKFLASAAFKAAIASAIKKFVVAIVLSSMIKFLAAKLGVSVAGAYAFVLIPVIAAYLAYEAYSLPENLASKISVQIKDSLDSEYAAINADIAMNLVRNVLHVGAGALITNISHNHEVIAAVKTVWQEVKDEIHS